MTNEEILKNAIVGVVCDELDYEHGNFQFYKEEVLQAMDEYASDLQSENERLKAEMEWILCDDDMPEVDETVWITNGCGWTALGCLVQCEGGYCWAVTNGIIYEEDDKIVSECELDDDYDVVYWHRLPKPPKQ